jgi:hypothetical protein
MKSNNYKKQYDNIKLQGPKNIQFVEGKLFEKVNEIRDIESY